MDIHKNARLTPHGRERLAKMIVCGQTPQAPVKAFALAPAANGAIALNRKAWRTEGRSSRPRRLRQPTPPQVIERIERLPASSN
jgi:hypothetical protein